MSYDESDARRDQFIDELSAELYPEGGGRDRGAEPELFQNLCAD